VLPDARGAGLALSFDGMDDFVRLDRTISEDFTIEGWIRTTESTGGTQFYHGRGLIYADVSGGANDFGTAIMNDHFCFGTGPNDLTVESSTIVTTGEWLHVAAVREMSTGTIRVLVNGVEEDSIDTGNRNPLDASATINLGGNTIDSRYFGGTMDEVRIWNVAKSNAEILDSMSRSLSSDTPNLVGYWNFDGADAQDATASANHGSLGGGAAMQTPSFVASDAPID
jgi:hypothetical protein